MRVCTTCAWTVKGVNTVIRRIGCSVPDLASNVANENFMDGIGVGSVKEVDQPSFEAAMDYGHGEKMR